MTGTFSELWPQRKPDGNPTRYAANLGAVRPFEAADDQMKFVPQFWSDGRPWTRFRLPRLKTVDAIDDALGAEFIGVLRRA